MDGGNQMQSPAEERLVAALKSHGMHVTTIESLTGGLIAARIVRVPGASDVLGEAYVTYCDEAKHRLAGVSRVSLARHTAVSRQVACEMAKGGARAAGAEVGISATGIAGPDGGTAKHPVGTVYTGCCINGETSVRHHLFRGDREAIRQSAAEAALIHACERLEEYSASNTDRKHTRT